MLKKKAWAFYVVCKVTFVSHFTAGFNSTSLIRLCVCLCVVLAVSPRCGTAVTSGPTSPYTTASSRSTQPEPKPRKYPVTLPHTFITSSRLQKLSIESKLQAKSCSLLFIFSIRLRLSGDIDDATACPVLAHAIVSFCLEQ